MFVPLLLASTKLCNILGKRANSAAWLEIQHSAENCGPYPSIPLSSVYIHIILCKYLHRDIDRRGVYTVAHYTRSNMLLAHYIE